MLIELPPPVRFDTEEHINGVFDHYETHGVAPRLTQVLFPILALGLRPHVGFERGLPAKLADHAKHGGEFALFMEYTHELDPFIMAAAIVHTALDGLRKGANIPAKPVLFDHPLRGWALSKVGGELVLRSQDLDNSRFELPSDPIARQALKALVNQRAQALSTANYDKGHSKGGFPRGKRKDRNDFSRITAADVRPGMIHALRDAARPENIAGVCAAVNIDHGLRHASVAFTDMVKHPAEMADELLLEHVATGMQNAVDLAAHMADRRAGRPGLLQRLLSAGA